jgi:membrane-associated phospholipid phosphatase
MASQDHPNRSLRNRLLATAALSVLALLAVYLLAVHTRFGQRFENAALAGASQHRSGSWYEGADRWLNFITAESFAVALLVIAAVGAVRRRWLLALCGVGTAGGALVLSSVLKRTLPSRPDLAFGAYEAHNTLPSGHATAAMALFFAMLIVVSRRWYLPVTLLGLPGAVGSGVATVAANWHRLSDTVAADFVVLAVGTAGLALMAQFGLIRRVPRVFSRSQQWLVLVVSASAAVTLIIGVTFLAHYNATDSFAQRDRDAYWSAQSLALGFALATAAAMLVVVGSIESVRRVPRRKQQPDSIPSPVRA